jgi:two-component system response regulator HydG
MFKVLVIDSSAEDAESLRGALEKEGAQVEVYPDGTAARPAIEEPANDYTAVFMLWDVAGPAFAETLAALRHRRPETPVVVTIEECTYELARRAWELGAADVLQKPLDAKKVIDCYYESLPRDDSPLTARLRERIIGESASLLAALRRLAGAIPNADLNVLLLGESGTGKELFAQAIHDFGPRPDAPFVVAQVSAIHEQTFESEMFGHEKGAFTGAYKRHIGFFEQAGEGTLFLDEIGDLSASAQIRLLRVIQEKKFRRMKGEEDLPFKARLVCATNHNLDEEAKHNKFRHDLYYRISKLTIYAPPLRERKGDIEILAWHFLNKYKNKYEGKQQVAFADETLKILCGYPFPGNVRLLEDVVHDALIACEREIILPRHLPMQKMNALLPDPPVTKSDEATDALRPGAIEPLTSKLARSFPADWLDLTYREAYELCRQAFDCFYLRNMYDRHGRNLAAAARKAGLDPKTFRNRLRESEPPLLKGKEEESDG